MTEIITVRGKTYYTKPDGTADFTRPVTNNNTKTDTSGITYSFGDIKDSNGVSLVNPGPAGSLANASVTDAWKEFMKYNAGNVLNIANAISSSPFTDASAAATWLKGKFEFAGTTPGGLAGFTAANGKFSIRGGSGGSGGSGSSSAYSAAQAKAQAELSAKAGVQDTLRYMKLENLTDWAWGKIVEGYSATDVANMIPDTPEYIARFPGIGIQRFTGQNEMTPAEYISFENGARDLADRYGFSKDLLSSEKIGNLTGGGTSLVELQDRFNNSYALVSQADPNVKAALTQYAGVTPAQMAQYWLDPAHTNAQLLEEAKKANVGGGAKDAGWAGDKNTGFISTDIATTLAQQGLTAAQAQAGYSKIAGLQGLERTQVGQRGQAGASAGQLQSSQFGGLQKLTGIDQAAAQTQIQRGLEARAAGLSGGGTFAAGAKGVVGAGRASTEGTGNA